MNAWDPMIAALVAAMKAGTYNEIAHERLKDAYREGLARDGAPCCGTTDVDHLPLCLTGRGVDLKAWLDSR